MAHKNANNERWARAEAVVLAGCAMAVACSAAPQADETRRVQQGILRDVDDRGDRVRTQDEEDVGSDALDEGERGERWVGTRARQGLAISPFAPVLTGRSDEDIERIGYGSYLVNAVAGCTDCHTNPAKPQFLAGGRKFPLDTAGHFVFARNLTADPSTGLQLSEEQFVEALRTGRDFHPGAATRLVVMPWAGYRWLTKGDIKAIYAYLRALPPISNAIPADFKDGLGLPAAVPFPTHFEQGDVRRRLPPDTVRIGPNSRRGLAIDPLRSPSDLGDDRAAFGRGSYLVDIASCNHCHTHETTDSILAASEGDDPFTQRLHTEVFLTGGRLFKRVSPPLGVARALTADLIGETHGFFREPASTFDRFRAVIRSGTHADETPPRPLAPPMPWPIFRNMVDDDLLAVFTYLSLAPPRTGSADKAIQNYARFCQTAAACRAGEACFANPATGGVGECVGGICSNDLDCDACQACVTGQCQAPGVGDVCLATGR